MARHPFVRGEQHPGPGFELPIPVDDAWAAGTAVRLAPQMDGAIVRLLRLTPGTRRTTVVTRRVPFDPFCRPAPPGSSAPLH